MGRARHWFRAIPSALKLQLIGAICGDGKTMSDMSARRTSRLQVGAKMDKHHDYAAPARLKLNHWALSGDWTMGEKQLS
ncbi:MAG: hypothetical protein DMG60_03140 [Acidobacteria bacterium]|nr:MAG: hypothetical protein DMG60_03140 [Acidobacteriota bacterium]